jgi:arginyl-tRNA synthetase
MKETKLIKNTCELKIILMQFMSILKDGKPFRMSKRQGNFVFFNDFIDAVGKDAASFFILDRSNDTHLEFDYDLAVQKSEQNPVYYTQYAYARICSILKKAKVNNNKPDLSLLTQSQEISLIKEILKLKDLLEEISKNYEVHSLTKYVVQLAKSFHSFYQACPIIQSNKKIQTSRIALLNATKINLELCFKIMNIQAKNKM